MSRWSRRGSVSMSLVPMSADEALASLFRTFELGMGWSRNHRFVAELVPRPVYLW